MSTIIIFSTVLLNVCLPFFPVYVGFRSSSCSKGSRLPTTEGMQPYYLRCQISTHNQVKLYKKSNLRKWLRGGVWFPSMNEPHSIPSRVMWEYIIFPKRTMTQFDCTQNSALLFRLYVTSSQCIFSRLLRFQ